MKKVFSSLIVILIMLIQLSTNVFASSSIDYNSELKSRSTLNSDNSISDNSVSKSDTKEIYLDSREAVSIATDFIESFYLTNDDLYSTKNEVEVLSFKNIDNIPLYDVDSNLNAYFLLLPKNKYCIVDARKDGYGVLESGDNDELLQKIHCFESNEKLFYVFPSIIFTEEELKEYIKNNSIDNPETLILPKPSEEINDFRKEIPSINRYGNEVVQLTNESNFVNVANRYYGGDQSWFSEGKLKNKGCGIVAAANIANHLSKYVSGYDEGLKKIMKGTSIKNLYKCAEQVNKNNLNRHAVFSFILGFPWESQEDMFKTLDTIYDLSVKYDIKTSLNWLILLPSRIWDERKKYGINIKEDFFDRTGWFTSETAFYTTHPTVTPKIFDQIERKIYQIISHGYDLIYTPPDFMLTIRENEMGVM